ncbi:MAG: 6-hydroxymethylpterin diphosphokinase MptE-like protein, partial [Planctomycetota bacterium]
VKIVSHPPSEARLGELASRFSSNFVKIISATRTTLATTLVHSTTTMHNLLRNVRDYVTRPGVLDLAGAAAGKPAIVVAAGPSLQRNIDQLAEPGVRDRFVIIAVQTVLKPLLARGIKPHFVVALDHHEISGRFYEGLSAEDVEGVTLVVEPKCSPAIMTSFPGRVRVTTDEWFDQVIGSELYRPLGTLKLGSTVAHLACYLARHLGCDPVITIGLDLGFTDNQYYAAGAAIHDVWASELGPFRSLEAFEWERVARQRALLSQHVDQLGRPIYTDEQLVSYLAQFESDFQQDRLMGLTVIDATEGGVAKLGADIMPLADAMAACGDRGEISLPETPADLGEDRVDRLREHLQMVVGQAAEVRKLCDDTVELLEEMAGRFDDPAAVDRLIDDVYRKRDRVRQIEPAYEMTQFINQAGALNRFKQDRRLSIESGEISDREKQRRQIARDIQNVVWLGDASDEVGRMTKDALAALDDQTLRVEGRRKGEIEVEPSQKVRIGAVIFADPDTGGLGTPRDLATPIARGENALQLTVRRVLQAENIEQVFVAGASRDVTARLLGPLVGEERVRIVEIDGERLRERTRAVGRSRLFSIDAWRGGLGGTTAADESLDPKLLLDVMTEANLDAALVCGADWALVDPVIASKMVHRRASHPEATGIIIAQAPPGLAGAVLDRQAVEALAKGAETVNPFATIGGLLGYSPRAPQADPIGKGLCVRVPPSIRDLGRRVVADASERAAWIGEAIERLGDDWLSVSGDELVRAIESAASPRDAAPQHLELELCTGRLSLGVWSAWLRAGDSQRGERSPIDKDTAIALVRELGTARPDTALTLHGVGDPLMHPAALEVIREARNAGVAAIHVRTDLLETGVTNEMLLDAGIDVLSVDLLAISPELYAGMHGQDRHEEIVGRAADLASGSIERGRGGLPSTWIVPRIVRCDESYQEIEAFYDSWILATGSAAIDPTPIAVPDARIEPFPLPTLARARRDRSMLIVPCDASESLESLWAAARDDIKPEIAVTATQEIVA